MIVSGSLVNVFQRSRPYYSSLHVQGYKRPMSKYDIHGNRAETKEGRDEGEHALSIRVGKKSIKTAIVLRLKQCHLILFLSTLRLNYTRLNA